VLGQHAFDAAVRDEPENGDGGVKGIGNLRAIGIAAK
jgi:hypothetical protein